MGTSVLRILKKLNCYCCYRHWENTAGSGRPFFSMCSNLHSSKREREEDGFGQQSLQFTLHILHWMNSRTLSV